MLNPKYNLPKLETKEEIIQRHTFTLSSLQKFLKDVMLQHWDERNIFKFRNSKGHSFTVKKEPSEEQLERWAAFLSVGDYYYLEMQDILDCLCYLGCIDEGSYFIYNK